MKCALIVLVLISTSASASNMERCSYKTEHDGKITSTVETPELADGSNQKRFANVTKWEEEGKEGWKGYRTFDVECTPLDDQKPVFHMFVQTRNGQVSLSHGLTEDACFYTLGRLNPIPTCNGCIYMSQGSDFERGECFK